MKGITHKGDNTTGEGYGDDEMIHIDLEKVADNVYELVVVVNIFTSGVSFANQRHDKCLRSLVYAR